MPQVQKPCTERDKRRKNTKAVTMELTSEWKKLRKRILKYKLSLLDQDAASILYAKLCENVSQNNDSEIIENEELELKEKKKCNTVHSKEKVSNR